MSSYSMPGFPQTPSVTSTPRRFAVDPPSDRAYVLPKQELVGREEDKRKIKKRLESVRMITLVGGAGYGKTSLAVQIAREIEEQYADGVRVVELAALNDPTFVPQVVAREIGVPESPDFPLLQSLRNYLRPRNMLLVLDNCEHIIEACIDLSNHILEAAPGMQILATSRKPLNTQVDKSIKHNSHIKVLALARPRTRPAVQVDAEEELPASIQLFQARASELGPHADFIVKDNRAVVRTICNKLRGIPLAIELAAARTDRLPDTDLVSHKLPALVTEYERHHNGLGTLRATISWTVDLLSDEDQDIFRQVSIFAGSFSLKAAEWVYGNEVEYGVADSLRRLEKNRLLRCTYQGDDPRYVMHDAIRDYVRETFTFQPKVRRRYLEWYVKLVAEAEDNFPSSDREAWLGRLDLEIDNIRAVLGWALEHRKIKEALSMAGSLSVYWFFRNNYSEGILWLKRVLGHAGASRHTRAYALALFGAGLLHRAKEDSEEARAFLERSVKLSRKEVAYSKDAQALRRAKWYLAFALTFLGLAERGLKDTGKSYAHVEESLSLFRELKFTWGEALTCTYLGNIKLAKALKLELAGRSTEKWQ
ncbi:MAG: hypothetical protein QOH93_3654, partial [Chloroflexia bacterium]|nr:hypothetical protein [Chloroflexia bacterium]